MYKVFINDRLLELTDQATDLSFEYQGQKQLNAWIADLRDGMKSSLVVRSDDLDDLWKAFASGYDLVEAAGGLVSNAEGHLLMIFRNGLWDLPKGKVEEGESAKVAAEREVEEECGLKAVKASQALGSSYHTYPLGNQQILKRTDWFLMEHLGQESLQPQQEEGITEVDWFTKEQVANNLNNTYRSIADLLRAHWL